MTITKKGHPIRTLDDWEQFAPPKHKNQWKSDRSALEAARSWLAVSSPALPMEVAAALASHPAFGSVTSWSAEPEVHLRFDQCGGPRQTDLLVHASDEHGDFLVALEAKADEPFGKTVGDELAAAVARRRANSRSRGVERIEQLALALFGSRLEEEPSQVELRYQLLTATAGAVAAAVQSRGARVVLLVQEFRTRETTDEKHERNRQDLDEFVRRLSNAAISRIDAGTVVGPVVIPGRPLFDSVPPLFIGKATRNLRA